MPIGLTQRISARLARQNMRNGWPRRSLPPLLNAQGWRAIDSSDVRGY
jgi:hypothetical protein